MAVQSYIDRPFKPFVCCSLIPGDSEIGRVKKLIRLELLLRRNQGSPTAYFQRPPSTPSLSPIARLALSSKSPKPIAGILRSSPNGTVVETSWGTCHTVSIDLPCLRESQPSTNQNGVFLCRSGCSGLNWNGSGQGWELLQTC